MLGRETKEPRAVNSVGRLVARSLDGVMRVRGAARCRAVSCRAAPCRAVPCQCHAVPCRAAPARARARWRAGVREHATTL
eukprot:8719471-Lingulodinium_polyedra.AAC.1